MDFTGLKIEIKEHVGEILESMEKVLERSDFIEGQEVKELELALEGLTGAQYCVSCASGTDALWLALKSIGAGPGDAVLVSPFSFIASADVISRAGATAVFVDIDGDSWCIDSNRIRAAMFFARGIGLNPKAIIGVDIFGVPCDYISLKDIARDSGAVVIADAAQSLGGSRFGISVGNLTEISCTSFFPTKPLGCFGDGGAVFCQSIERRDRIRSLKAHGKKTKRDKSEVSYEEIGTNSRLDTLQAGILCAKLKWFEMDNFKRNAIAEKYRGTLKNVQFQAVPTDGVSAYAQFGILSARKNIISETLLQRGIPSRVYYARGIHEERAFRMLNRREETFPITERVCREILCLPMHSYLKEEEVDLVCEVVNSVS